MSDTATLSSLWRAMAPPAAVPDPPSVAEIAAAADAVGEARGRAAAAAELAPLRASYGAVIEAWRAATAIDADTLQPLFAELVTRIASAAIDGELRTGPEAVARLVAAALAAIELDGEAVVHVSADDALVADGVAAIVDPALAPGEIRIETPRHVIAASLAARLAEIVAA